MTSSNLGTCNEITKYHTNNIQMDISQKKGETELDIKF